MKTPSVLRLMSVLALSAFWLVLSCAPVLAHANLLRAQPAAGANLSEPPNHVRLSFSEPVDAAFSPLKVYDSEGDRVDEDNARVDPDDARAVVVALEDDLSRGSYEVEWRVTSIDGHVLDGTYNFTVASNAGGGAPNGGEERRAQPGAQRGAAGQENAGGSGRVMLYSVLSLGALGVVALAVVGGRRLRQRKP